MGRAVNPLGLLALTADPTGRRIGDHYYNSISRRIRVYDGSAWTDLSLPRTQSFSTLNPSLNGVDMWRVNHGLGSENVIVTLRRAQAPYYFVDVYVEVIDANTIAIGPDQSVDAGTMRLSVFSDSVFTNPTVTNPLWSFVDWTDLPLDNGFKSYRDRNNVGVSYPQYMRSANGIVYVKGLIGGGTIAQDASMATLPAGFRPAEQRHYIGAAAGFQTLFFSVTATGVMPQKQALTSSTAWFSLDNISFPAQQ